MTALKSLVLATLRSELAAEESASEDRGKWSVQGFGMLRLYLPGDKRLNLWTSDHRVPGVSDVHTHPWHFVSHVVAGVVEQFRYSEVDWGPDNYDKYWMRTGPGGGVVDHQGVVKLQVRGFREIYPEGSKYRQTADEVHSSHPIHGTVTVVCRAKTDHPDHAYTYAPVGTKWVSAEPRDATRREVVQAISYSLGRWF